MIESYQVTFSVTVQTALPFINSQYHAVPLT